MTNATIANELRDYLTWWHRIHDVRINPRVLDAAVHEVSTAWRGAGIYRIDGAELYTTSERGSYFENANDLAWDAYHAALHTDTWDAMGQLFNVTYLAKDY